MDLVTIDGNLLIGIQEAMHAEWLTPVMKAITLFGESGIFWIAVCLLLMIFRKTRRLGIICSLSLAFTFLCCNLTLKPLVDRTRPWVLFEGVIALMPDPGDASFPSGHSADSMGPAWAMFLASSPVSPIPARLGGKKSYEYVPCLGWKGVGADPRLVHRLSICAVILSVLIGLSRLYLGMHFPTDVACGLLLGMICATFVYSMFRGFELKRGLVGGEKSQ